jgi:hypothetical protein
VDDGEGKAGAFNRLKLILPQRCHDFGRTSPVEKTVREVVPGVLNDSKCGFVYVLDVVVTECFKHGEQIQPKKLHS